MKKNLIN